MGSFIHHDIQCFYRVTFPGNGLGEAALTLKMQLLVQPIPFKGTHGNVLGDGTNKLMVLCPGILDVLLDFAHLAEFSVWNGFSISFTSAKVSKDLEN